MSEHQWKTVSVVGFDELMQALERADRKGYMSDALKEEWEAFDWKPKQPAQRKPLTDEQISGIITASTGWTIPQSSHYCLARAIEAAHGIYAPTELKEDA